MNPKPKAPSIFTVPGSYPKKPTEPPKTRAPRTSSPFRRLSTPDYHEANTIQAASEQAVKESPAPSTLAHPPDPPSNQTTPNPSRLASLWGSFVGEQTSPLGRGRSASVSLVRTPTTEFPVPTTPVSTGTNSRKRAIPSGTPSGPTSEPLPKKPRLKPRNKHTLDCFSFPGPSFNALQPPSPLFFSNSPRPRPQLPPRFSSSEAAARMLSKARGEDAHVKTVSLARGTLSTHSSSTTSAPIPHRASLDRSSAARSSSPEVHGAGSMGMLSSIGIIELLEQDERPTFIVDLADAGNYGPGNLNTVFANSSLRAYSGLHDLVSGSSMDESPGQTTPNTFLQFKSWVLSAAVNGESLNVCLPSFMFAGMSWSCSTLRKRLRLISGTFPNQTSNSTSSDLPLSMPQPQSVLSAPLHSGGAPHLEPSDYFGSAAPPAPTKPMSVTSNSTATSILPTTELPNGDATQSLQDPFEGPSPQMYVHLTPSSHPMQGPTPSTTSDVDWLSRNMPLANLAQHQPDGFFDWTRLPVTPTMPSHIQFARGIDWASTSLGPIEHWSSDLRQMCNLIMASPHPAAMYWGEDLVAIYNEAYILLAGQKHPTLMGQSYKTAWSEIWDDVKDVFASAKITGEATMKDDDCLFIKRHDFLEETYFSWSIIPMVGGDGSVMGLYNPAFEKTRRKIAERRMLTLREIGERTAAARDVKGFWEQVMGAFEFNEYDSPFLLLYSVADESDSDTSSIHSSSVLSTRLCLLEGSLGVPEGHDAAPDNIDLKSGMEGFGPVFREVMKTDKPVLLEIGSRDLPASLLDGLEWRGFGDPCRAIVVCPIHPTTGENILGFLVLGVNPRRPYDDDYSLFVQLLSRQLATSLASVVLFEEEIRRGQKAAKLAALDRIELSEQLAARTQEAIESETKFTRMAEFAPIGLFIAGSDGKISYCNDTWYEISRVPKESADMSDRWMQAVKEEDQPKVRKLWNDLVQHTKPQTAEFRFKAPWEDRNGTRGDTWVLFSAYPERYESGALKSVFGSITNISQTKWAEGIQTRKMEEAVELKRQQENFIDITSHEMRNPLSAILQCADEITLGINAFRNAGDRTVPDELLTSNLDAAQTIALCAQHQKRIVDDILTLSKLDSALLLVTPVDAQPLTVVQRALKMHEGELMTADIQMKFVVDHSFKDLQIDWVRLDPSRVLQVLINLTTNAIKFTTTESKRTITVTIAASRDRPSERLGALVSYFPTRNKRNDFMEGPDWGDGEEVYIHFSVKDTGRGLNPEEKKLLFLRFSQASPRTHVQYGGSGLGLFISRELTELQGGEIGVDSEAGKGSTFAFYVKARRSTQPPEEAGVVRQPSDSKGKKETLVLTNRESKTLKPPSTQVNANASTNGMPKKGVLKKVLIVEDNLVNQRVLQKQLKNLGCIVQVANHGGEALDRLRESTYWAEAADGGKKPIELSVILMDQEMPVMDGLTCTRRIRELEKEGKLKAHVPIIAVTANARQEQIQTALNAGMDDVVSKPFRIPELVPKIEELMERYPEPGPA